MITPRNNTSSLGFALAAGVFAALAAPGIAAQEAPTGESAGSGPIPVPHAIAAAFNPESDRAPHSAGKGSTVFRVAKILTFDDQDRFINNAAVVVKDGDIAWAGRQKDLTIDEGATVIDADGLWLIPGYVELHNHTAGDLGDLNDGVYLTNPGLRTLETVVTNSDEVRRAQAGGVTSALLIPGSGNNMAGFGTAVKFAGDSVEQMVQASPGSLKIAQAGNPEWYWLGVGRSFMNWNTRGTLVRAKDYHERWNAYESGKTTTKPEFNPSYDEFRGLFRREFPASVHTQGYQLVMSTVQMLANELGIRTVLDHSTFDGYGIAPYVLETGEDNVMTMVGPRGLYFDFRERRVFGIVKRWYQGGVRRLGINTDAPVIPQEELVYQGAMACWLGFEPYLALKGLTRVGAEALLIDEHTGTIEPGKDADFVIWSGHPLDPRSHVRMTIVNGEIVYNTAEDPQRF
ncbi:MAG: amidohydrolase family protein [Phycisphaerales bacterium]